MNSGQQPRTFDPISGPPPADALPEKQPDVAGPIPRWAWAFVLACMAIPVSTLSSVLLFALGAAGAFACTNVARDETRPLKTRLVQCGTITVVCWILFLLVASGTSHLRTYLETVLEVGEGKPAPAN